MRKKEILPLLGICTVLTFLIVGSLLLEDVAFSSNENRYLQQVPELNVQTFFGGEFEEDFEAYLSDQIIFRDRWMEMKSSLQRLIGKKDVNQVYIGQNGYYFEKVTEDSFPQEQFEKNVSYLEAFSKKVQGDFTVLIAPTPATVLADKLPKNAQEFNADSRYQTLKDNLGQSFVDVRDAISQVEDPYYHTDHHWTTFGAQAAYESWCATKGITPKTWTLTQVSDSFYGTMYSKVLLPDARADSVYAPLEITIESMECDGEAYTSYYFEDRLEKKDHYEFFMGGNYAMATIKTGASTGKNLLVIKDSFANSFLPFVLDQYDVITVLDLRYYSKGINSFLEENTDVLVLYELTNFAGEANVAKLTIDK